MARGRSRGSSKSKSSSKGVPIDMSADYNGDVKFAVAAMTDDQVIFEFWRDFLNSKNMLIFILKLCTMMAVSHLATMKVTPDEHGKRRFMSKLRDPNFKKVSFSYNCSDSKNVYPILSLVIKNVF